MSVIQNLASLANQRAPLNTSYAGEVMPREAYEALLFDPTALLVDVRTDAEWKFSGTPDLSATNKRPILLSWRYYPDFAANIHFISELSARVPDKETAIFFLCKTGGRSFEAANALASEGYTQCFNVTGGFEGESNAQGQRGRLNGWKAEELPWQQA